MEASWKRKRGGVSAEGRSEAPPPGRWSGKRLGTCGDGSGEEIIRVWWRSRSVKRESRKRGKGGNFQFGLAVEGTILAEILIKCVIRKY